MGKRPPELTWQDKAILITIPGIVLLIFVVSNYLIQDVSVSEAFTQQLSQVEVRDVGNIVQLIPSDADDGSTQKCRLRSLDGRTEFTFIYNVQASETMPLEIGRTIQFYGRYRYDQHGGTVEAPYREKDGGFLGWAVYGNRRYAPEEEPQ